MSGKKDFQNVLVSLFSRFLYQFISMLVIFLMMPFMIKKLGDYTYGIWILVTILVNYVGFVEFGVTSAIQRNLAVAAGKNNENDFNDIFNNGLFLNFIIFFIILAITLAGFFIVIFLKIKDYKLLSTLILIMGLNIAQTFLFKTYSSVLNAYIRFDLLSTVMTVQLILINLPIYFALIKGYGLITMALCTLLATFISNFFYIYYAKKIAGFIKINFRLINKNSIKNLLNYSGKTVLIQISSLFRMRMDEIVIAAFISVTQVTIYSVASRLIGCVISLGNLFLGVLNPLIAKNEGAKTAEQKIKIFYFTSKIIIVMFSLILFGVIYLGNPFIKLWVGSQYEAAFLPLIILMMFQFLGYVQGVGLQYMFANNTHQYYGYIGIIEGVLNLACSIIFVVFLKLGILGVSLGSLVPAIFTRIIAQPVLVSKILNLKITDYYVFFFKSIAAGAIIFIPTGLFSLKYPPKNYTELILQIFIYILTAIIYFFVILNKQEKTDLASKLAFGKTRTLTNDAK